MDAVGCQSGNFLETNRIVLVVLSQVLHVLHLKHSLLRLQILLRAYHVLHCSIALLIFPAQSVTVFELADGLDDLEDFTEG